MRLIKGVRVARQLALRPIVSSTRDQIVGAVADPAEKGMSDRVWWGLSVEEKKEEEEEDKKGSGDRTYT